MCDFIEVAVALTARAIAFKVFQYQNTLRESIRPMFKATSGATAGILAEKLRWQNQPAYR
jgi:hypothetical protein